MTAQMIRPHTMMPTVHAAIQEPCHSVSVTWPCLVTGTGMPMRVNAVDLHPVVTISSAAPSAARGAQHLIRAAPSRRGALRLGLTDCLPSGWLPAPLAGHCSSYSLSWKTVPRGCPAPGRDPWCVTSRRAWLPGPANREALWHSRDPCAGGHAALAADECAYSRRRPGIANVIPEDPRSGDRSAVLPGIAGALPARLQGWRCGAGGGGRGGERGSQT